jgi:hypothetical protein
VVDPIKRMVLVVAAITLSACASGKQIDEDRIGKYKKGVSTEREIAADFGRPTMTTINADGSKVEVYNGVSKKIASVAFTFDADGLLRAFSIYSAPPASQ